MGGKTNDPFWRSQLLTAFIYIVYIYRCTCDTRPGYKPIKRVRIDGAHWVFHPMVPSCHSFIRNISYHLAPLISLCVWMIDARHVPTDSRETGKPATYLWWLHHWWWFWVIGVIFEVLTVIVFEWSRVSLEIDMCCKQRPVMTVSRWPSGLQVCSCTDYISTITKGGLFYQDARWCDFSLQYDRRYPWNYHHMQLTHHATTVAEMDSSRGYKIEKRARLKKKLNFSFKSITPPFPQSPTVTR